MFVALRVPFADEFSGVLDQLRDRGARPVVPERLHLTLAFMAAVPPERVAAVEDATLRVANAHEPFALSTTGRIQRFGRQVAWAEVVEAPEAQATGGRGTAEGMATALAEELRRADVAVADRVFRPHLTLARGVRGGIRADTVAGLCAPVVAWTVNAVELIESRLGGGPAVWTTVRTARLLGRRDT